MAAVTGQRDVVQVLMEHGACNLNAQNNVSDEKRRVREGEGVQEMSARTERGSQRIRVRESA